MDSPRTRLVGELTGSGRGVSSPRAGPAGRVEDEGHEEGAMAAAGAVWQFKRADALWRERRPGREVRWAGLVLKQSRNTAACRLRTRIRLPRQGVNGDVQGWREMSAGATAINTGEGLDHGPREEFVGGSILYWLRRGSKGAQRVERGAFNGCCRWQPWERHGPEGHGDDGLWARPCLEHINNAQWGFGPVPQCLQRAAACVWSEVDGFCTLNQCLRAALKMGEQQHDAASFHPRPHLRT